MISYDLPMIYIYMIVAHVNVRHARLGWAMPMPGQQAGDLHARGVAPLRYAAGSSRWGAVRLWVRSQASYTKAKLPLSGTVRDRPTSSSGSGCWWAAATAAVAVSTAAAAAVTAVGVSASSTF